MESLIATRLNTQWRELATTACPTQWGLPFVNLDQARSAARADEYAGRLVALAQTGDQLAGRVLVQALVPILIAISRRHPSRSLDEFVSTTWLRIADYPIATRQRAVLTNIALDVLKILTRAGRSQELPTAEIPEQRHDESGDELTATAVIETSRRLQLVTDQTADVLVSIYADGMTGRQAAAHHGLTETAVRRRCADATQRMRQHAALLLEAA